ncbi:MAG: 50S ribosomal protein L25 [Pyrinomonadaceae bacterium]|nr:50S ribosomal protein L25 [Pyrinomonadaceae bacterium]
MADKIVVKAEIRNEFGKNVNRRLRAAGKVPVVVYGGGTESVSVAADLKDLAAILRTDSGVNTVFSLDIDGEGVHDVLFQDRQIDPIKGRLIHADLRRFARGEKIEMTVQLNFVGEPEFQLEEGMMVSHNIREIKLLTEPTKAPESIEVDVTGLTPEHSIHISDLKVPAGAEIHEDPETVVASISVVKEAELEPQVEEGAEPEVVGEGGAEGGEE